MSNSRASSRSSFPLLFTLAALAAAPTVAAQCASSWLPGFGYPGVGSPTMPGQAIVRASVEWDPDGAGPITPKIVVGGEFTNAGSVLAQNLAVYDPATSQFTALGSGMNGAVFAVAALPNGDLVAAGDFTTAGGVAANRIARWNGSAWAPFGLGMENSVRALKVLANGDLVAAGAFVTAGGLAVNRIARWTGSLWLPYGSGLNGPVYALAQLASGEIVAGGGFSSASGVAAQRIARWTGATWAAFGGGLGSPTSGGSVQALAVLPTGELVAGGGFTASSGAPVDNIGRWNGSAWVSVGGANGSVQSLVATASGELIAAGLFTAIGGVNAVHIARGVGSSWSAAPFSTTSTLGFEPIFTLTRRSNGDVYAGGPFVKVRDVIAHGVARWNGAQAFWAPLATGFDGHVQALATAPNGDVVVGGAFKQAGDVLANGVARWNGSSWSGIGNGNIAIVGVAGAVNAVLVQPNGNVVVGGAFSSVSGLPFANIAYHDGMIWYPLGGSANGAVRCLARLPNGDLVAGGSFTIIGGVSASRIARWNGSAWSALGAGASDAVDALAVMPNGDLVAGGAFTAVGGTAADRIARWNGVAWSAMGSGMSDVVASLAVQPDGTLVAGGAFASAGGVAANGIARWTGSAWASLGSGCDGYVTALTALPTGELIAGGMFTTMGGAAARNLARWNGGAWAPFNGGADGTVNALVVRAGNELVVGGLLSEAGGQSSPHLARFATPCAPSVVTFGGACAGSGGANSYVAVTQPWLNTVYRTRGTGLAFPAFAAVVTGFGPTALPLNAVLPSALFGCALWASPDIVDVLISTNGTLEPQLFLPNNPALASTPIHQQLVLLKYDANLTFVETTSTNGLVATVGVF